MSLSAIGSGFGRNESVAPPSELLPNPPLASSAAAAPATSFRPNAPRPTAAAAVRDSKLRRERPCSSAVRVYWSSSFTSPRLSVLIVTSFFRQHSCVVSHSPRCRGSEWEECGLDKKQAPRTPRGRGLPMESGGHSLPPRFRRIDPNQDAN